MEQAGFTLGFALPLRLAALGVNLVRFETFTLYLQKRRHEGAVIVDGGGGRIRTYVVRRRRSYNPMHLTALPPLHIKNFDP